jgi:hypothetical protein
MLRALIIAMLAVLLQVGSALAAYTEFYIDGSHGSASNINGGSSSGAALFSKTNGNWNTTTKVFTVGAGDTLTSDLIGHFACVCLDGATGASYLARVDAVDNAAKTLTLSSTATTGTAPSTLSTGRTIKIGGCWAGMSSSTLFPMSLASSCCNLTNSNGDAPRFNFKGTYSVTSGMTNSFCGASNKNGPFISGFGTTPGDETLATFNYTSSGSIATVAHTASGQYWYDSIEFKNDSTSGTPTASYGASVGASASTIAIEFKNCRFKDTKAQGVFSAPSTGTSVIRLRKCEFINCGNGNTTSGGGMLTVSNGNARLDIEQCLFRGASGCTAVIQINTLPVQYRISQSVFDGNSVPVIQHAGNSQGFISDSVFYNNSGGAINIVANSGTIPVVFADRCIFESNAYVQNITALTNNRNTLFTACGYYSNTTKFDANSSGRIESDCFDFTASPLVDAANGDYRTRSTMGRNRVNGTITNSSKSLTTKRYLDVGIGPSNPFYRGQ